MENRKQKIMHIITGLNTGGAEMMLYEFLSKMDETSFDTEVISLTNIGHIGQASTHRLLASMSGGG